MASLPLPLPLTTHYYSPHAPWPQPFPSDPETTLVYSIAILILAVYTGISSPKNQRIFSNEHDTITYHATSLHKPAADSGRTQLSSICGVPFTALHLR